MITCTVATAPSIAVTLACPAVPAATGGLITYTGTVRNSGNVTLNNVVVVNNQAVPSTVLTVPSLAPGASANFTASFTAPSRCLLGQQHGDRQRQRCLHGDRGYRQRVGDLPAGDGAAHHRHPELPGRVR